MTTTGALRCSMCVLRVYTTCLALDDTYRVYSVVIGLTGWGGKGMQVVRVAKVDILFEFNYGKCVYTL